MSVTSNEKVLIFVGLIVIVLDVLLANGCAFEPVLAPNGGEATQSALYIIAENTFSVEKSSGEDAVLVAVVVRNASGRCIEFSLPTASFHGVIGRELDTTFENVRYTSSEGILGRGRALTGSFDYVAFDRIVALESGETIELALRADIPSGARIASRSVSATRDSSSRMPATRTRATSSPTSLSLATHRSRDIL